MMRLSTETVFSAARRLFVAAAVCALFTGAATVPWQASFASKTELVSVAADKQKKDPTLVLTQGMADIVEVDGPVSDIMVADPSIVDVMVLQANRLYMVGSAIGTTNVIAVDAEGNVVRRMNVRVKIDDGAIQDSLTDLFPDEKIKVSTVGQQVMLSGDVSTPDVANRVVNLVSRLVSQETGQAANIDTSLINMMKVAGEQQVMLRVKIVEASRDVLRELGISSSFSEAEPGGILSNVSGALASVAGAGLTATPLGTASVLFDDTNDSLGPISLAIRALEQDGLLSTLAEPTMTAISGEEAGFLAGGEFPVPTSLDEQGNVVVSYRPFGVALNFRPSVMSSERISMQLSTEVSSISQQNSYSIGALNIPGFSVRRAQTTVEMASGGSLMIAGLLKSDASKLVSEMPGLKDIPIIGRLMSSDSFQREESELVVIVTAYLVEPFADKSQATEAVSNEREPLADAFEQNIRRVYNRRPLEDDLFDGKERYGYLLD